ncbi:radical SAM/SPASM domain-containing protein [uncultured Desulfovibrio sp.]|uniref:radical SAM protein n=1 Tax=uncultured Desulfovibrio sp. TaxID=167968 RepID=UPI0026191E0B|nr:radical SAM/SPASM domain-containing protein [uncultured Desulfovibrio sp.]
MLNCTNQLMSSVQTCEPPISSVFLELTSRCNMNCSFCPIGVLKRKKQDMAHENVLKVLDELKGIPCDITFHTLGEPFLNPRFDEYLTICDQNDIHYWITTNGLLLTASKQQQLFRHKNLRLVEISLHTISDRSMSLRGVNISFAEYLKKIKNIVFSKERFENNIQIRLDVMYDLHLFYDKLWKGFSAEEWGAFQDVMEKWREELEQMYPEARERYANFYNGRKKIFSRGDHYLYRRREDIPNDLFHSLPEHITWLNWEVFPNFFVTLKKFFIFTPDAEYLQQSFGGECKINITPAYDFSCTFAHSLVILSNGDITFCCLDYEGVLSCGNIADMTLTEAVQSKNRRVVLSKPDSFEYCRNCKGKLEITSCTKETNNEK